MSPNLPEKMTAQEVPESERLNCLPRHLGRWMMDVENLIYDFMREMSPDYNGAYWRFFDPVERWLLHGTGSQFRAGTRPQRERIRRIDEPMLRELPRACSR